MGLRLAARWHLLIVALGAALGLAAGGCTTSCEELQAVCDECEEPYHKASCEQTVDSDDTDDCDVAKTDFCAICGRRSGTLAEACQ